MTYNEITNVREMPEGKSNLRKVFENLQYLNLGLTIIGQITVGSLFILGQGLWLVANIIAVVRDFVLQRPSADIVRDSVMTAITVGIIAIWLLGAY